MQPTPAAINLDVRPFRLDDAAAIEPWLTGPGLSLPGGMARRTWPQHLLANARIVARIAETRGHKVGFVRLDCGPDRVAELTLVVAPEWRRKGLGTALFQAALRQARSLGLCQLLAIIDRGNARAQEFFEHQGFTLDGLQGDRLRYVRLVHNGDPRPLDVEV
jgi:GNAT superfamily N-acetyltransferase